MIKNSKITYEGYLSVKEGLLLKPISMTDPPTADPAQNYQNKNSSRRYETVRDLNGSELSIEKSYLDQIENYSISLQSERQNFLTGALVTYGGLFLKPILSNQIPKSSNLIGKKSRRDPTKIIHEGVLIKDGKATSQFIQGPRHEQFSESKKSGDKFFEGFGDNEHSPRDNLLEDHVRKTKAYKTALMTKKIKVGTLDYGLNYNSLDDEDGGGVQMDIIMEELSESKFDKSNHSTSNISPRPMRESFRD